MKTDPTGAPDWGTSHFRDRVDPSDPNFRIVEIRMPHDARTTGYGPFEFTGPAAAERLRRYCAAYLSGVGDITTREAEKIIKKSHAADDRRSSRKPS